MSDWFVYLIRCHNDTLYAGICVDLERRLSEHRSGGPKSAKYLRGKGPLEMVFSHPAPDRSVASKWEYQLKRLPKQTKEQLIRGVLDPQEVLILKAD